MWSHGGSGWPGPARPRGDPARRRGLPCAAPRAARHGRPARSPRLVSARLRTRPPPHAGPARWWRSATPTRPARCCRPTWPPGRSAACGPPRPTRCSWRAALGAPLTDAACASAGVKEMTAAQRTYLGTNPPQLTALAPDDRLVLLTLGGDDIGFLNVLKECMELSFTDPWGSPCRAHYTGGGTDQLAAAASRPRRRRWPRSWRTSRRARRGRGSSWSATRTCSRSPAAAGPAVPITGGDVAYLRGIEVKLNAMLAADARGGRAPRSSNTYTPDRSATTSASRRRSGTSRACCPARWRSRSTRTPAARRRSPPRCSPRSSDRLRPGGVAAARCCRGAASGCAGAARAPCGTARRAAGAAGWRCSPPRPAPSR